MSSKGPTKGNDKNAPIVGAPPPPPPGPPPPPPTEAVGAISTIILPDSFEVKRAQLEDELDEILADDSISNKKVAIDRVEIKFKKEFKATTENFKPNSEMNYADLNRRIFDQLYQEPSPNDDILKLLSSLDQDASGLTLEQLLKARAIVTDQVTKYGKLVDKNEARSPSNSIESIVTDTIAAIHQLEENIAKAEQSLLRPGISKHASLTARMHSQIENSRNEIRNLEAKIATDEDGRYMDEELIAYNQQHEEYTVALYEWTDMQKLCNDAIKPLNLVKKICADKTPKRTAKIVDADDSNTVDIEVFFRDEDNRAILFESPYVDMIREFACKNDQSILDVDIESVIKHLCEGQMGGCLDATQILGIATGYIEIDRERGEYSALQPLKNIIYNEDFYEFFEETVNQVLSPSNEKEKGAENIEAIQVIENMKQKLEKASVSGNASRQARSDSNDNTQRPPSGAPIISRLRPTPSTPNIISASEEGLRDDSRRRAFEALEARREAAAQELRAQAQNPQHFDETVNPLARGAAKDLIGSALNLDLTNASDDDKEIALAVLKTAQGLETHQGIAPLLEEQIATLIASQQREIEVLEQRIEQLETPHNLLAGGDLKAALLRMKELNNNVNPSQSDALKLIQAVFKDKGRKNQYMGMMASALEEIKDIDTKATVNNNNSGPKRR